MARGHDLRLGLRRRLVRAACATAVVVPMLLVTGEARAFCRLTACEPSKEKCAKDENGCPRTGPPLSWRSLPIPYRFHRGGTEKLDMDRVREATRRAFQTWSNVTCNGEKTSLKFEEGSDLPGSHPLTATNPPTFGIYFRDDNWPGNDPEESLAQTNQKYGKTNGWIDYSAIEINTTERTYKLIDSETEGIDFQAVVTHEVGHYIGFAHSSVESSIMVPSYCQSKDRCGTSTDEARALADDDIAAVCALYPPGGIAGVAYEDPNATSCAVSSRDRDSRSPAVPLATVAALGALLVLRKRRG
jgi:MYXO-CTERM domain-containing protein